MPNWFFGSKVKKNRFNEHVIILLVPLKSTLEYSNTNCRN
jgi:hypothetical protein